MSAPAILAGAFGLGGPEVAALVFVAVLLFGAKRLPELARGAGSALREFKKASREDGPEEDEVGSRSSATVAPASGQASATAEAPSAPATEPPSRALPRLRAGEH